MERKFGKMVKNRRDRMIFCILAVISIISIGKFTLESIKRYPTAREVGLAEFSGVEDLYEVSDAAVMTCDNNGGIDYVFAKKDSRGWKRDHTAKTIYKKTSCSIHYFKTDHVNVIFIMPFFGNLSVPTDNYGNNFHCFQKTIFTESDGEQKEFTVKAWALILKEIPEDYGITFDGQQIPIFVP